MEEESDDNIRGVHEDNVNDEDSNGDVPCLCFFLKHCIIPKREFLSFNILL